jgi:hypothetical protein
VAGCSRLVRRLQCTNSRDGRRTLFRALCIFLLGSVTAHLKAQTLEKEKILEGQYVRMKSGNKVAGSEQSWTLWRIPGAGYELEDHFDLAPNPAAQLFSQMPSKNLSPELRKELAAEVTQSDLIVRFGVDRKPMSLTIKGKKLQDGTKIDVLKCDVDGQEFRCNGNIHPSKLRTQEQRELFYAMPFPMLLSMWLPADPLKPETMQRQLVVLEFGKVFGLWRLKKPLSLRAMKPSRLATITLTPTKFKSVGNTREARKLT